MSDAKRLKALIAACAELKEQFVAAPLDTPEAQGAAFRVVVAYDAYVERRSKKKR